VSKPKSSPNRLLQFLRVLGPGLITGASDDDPSGIGTYAQAGARFGFSTLWLLLLTTPLAISVQYICAKVALVSGEGLAATLHKRFSRRILVPAVLALLVANTINAGVDIGAIAAGLNLLVPLPATLFVVPVAVLILVLLIAGSYALIERIFKWLTLVLLAYVASAFFARPDFGAVVVNTFVPVVKLDNGYLLMLVAILGTTISPYLFFFQSQDEVESEKNEGRKTVKQRRGVSRKKLGEAGLDVGFGIVLSNVVSYFIILASGATLHAAGKTNIGSAADAAKALQPLAGDAATILFAIGIVGSGFLAVPILVASGSYAVAELFGWRRGLDEKPERARSFYLVIALSTLAGMLINFLGINPIDALFWTAVLNGFLAPPLLVLIMLIANDSAVMGARTNNRWTNLLGWATAFLMGGAAVAWVVLSLSGG
jgi:NRAMP (natural resistance-associated macrophage protein)-like metal ion transporter